ncbi:MAG: hypothetical protein V5A66_03045 [Candidatus Thermoplasmatota archaeon]
MYNRIKKFGVVFLVSLLIAALLVPVPTSGQAEKPEWEEGDEWAMGVEKDLEELFAPGLNQVDDMINQTEENDEVKEINYDVEGEMGFYQVYEVTEANDDGYVMEIEAGGGIEASGSLEMSGEMAEEGEYDLDEEPPKVNKTISVEGEIFFMLDVQGTIHYNETFAIEKIDTNYSLEFSTDFSVENFPSNDRDRENNTQSWEYKDFSGGMSAEASLQIQMDFEPALDLLDFPIEENENWKAESTVTTSGTYEGIIEVDDEELPEELQQVIKNYEEKIGEEFPIVLEEMDTETEGINNGNIEETSENITIPMKCTGKEEVVLPDGTTIDAYAIEFDTSENVTMTQEQEPSFQMMYSAEEDFIVSQQMDLGDQMGSEVGNMVEMDTMQMESMDADEAQDSMDEMQGEAEENEESPGFTFGLLLLGTVIVVAIYYKKEQ